MNIMQEAWYVKGSRLKDLETKAKELTRAESLIKRLRAKNNVLKMERSDMKNAAADRYTRLTSIQHKYGFRLALKTIGIEI